MPSDVKLSHYFVLIRVINRDVFLTLKSFRKQFQSTSHSLNVGEHDMNEYEWSLPQVIVSISHFKIILQLFSQK